ncbi:hypothetical protein [Spirosoma sp. KUDC1026]|uniref:hypothetical protein n=1 Tax=Spirosoma sp. KUDC1026 TaxID=2745947 RepID=UPI00159BBCA3|nr:hypothetical protein [Spirosoma sp. KUDC1026]QKZ14575.1 hypothetical protein HU175_18875 [Spirosoma sp. KUDC1026]
MNAKWLFPHRFRLIGWIIFVPLLLLGLANRYADFRIRQLNVSSWLLFGEIGNNLTDEFAGVGVIVGLLLIAFSKEKVEDEMISRIRLEALQWSVYANYLLLAIAMLTVYNGAFLEVMVYNMFTVLLVFIGRFRWLLYRHTNAMLTL